MGDCIFCRIVSGDVPAEKVYEDGEVLAFRDINPVAPVHILIVPKIGHMFYVARIIAEEQGIAPAEDLSRGYRLVFNVGKDAGQTVFHLHLHLIGGRPMSWPPG